MVTGVDRDPSRQAVLRATIAFAHEVGARIVAEGVERDEELALLREAGEVILDHLARLGLMPSVYVEQGGRLRCLGARGYWQIYDGMPLSAGVVGATFRTGPE